MATTAEDFQSITNELVDGEFAFMKGPFTATRQGAFNPSTEEYAAGATYSIGSIRSNLSYKQFQNQLIQTGDFNLVINPRTPLNSGTYFEPRINDQCTFKGASIQIISKDVDDANAAVKLVCRYL